MANKRHGISNFKAFSGFPNNSDWIWPPRLWKGPWKVRIFFKNWYSEFLSIFNPGITLNSIRINEKKEISEGFIFDKKKQRTRENSRVVRHQNIFHTLASSHVLDVQQIRSRQGFLTREKFDCWNIKMQENCVKYFIGFP